MVLLSQEADGEHFTQICSKHLPWPTIQAPIIFYCVRALTASVSVLHFVTLVWKYCKLASVDHWPCTITYLVLRINIACTVITQY